MASQDLHNKLAALTLGAIGIVYGDIGASPLYPLKTVFDPTHGLALTGPNLLGVVSLIFWGLTTIVSLKYVTLVLRADNHGEGGIMALMALALGALSQRGRLSFALLLVGVFGAALFYGDSVITPAISVLSAIEGGRSGDSCIQAVCGTNDIGGVNWPVRGAAARHGGDRPLVRTGDARVVLRIGGDGSDQHRAQSAILAALNPWHALRFLIENRMIAFIALGAIVLAFTGAESLYADMGHFGKQPIRVAWFAVAFPALALNYLGQGGLLLVRPEAISNPFYQQLGSWSVYPLVALSTVATVIASQATISGTFSMTKQAIALGFLPRMRITHTSEREISQIYIPAVNWAQLIAVSRLK